MRTMMRHLAILALSAAVAGCGRDLPTTSAAPPEAGPSFNHIYNPVIQYSAYVEGIGWQPFVTAGQVAGTTGQFRRMEALRINAYAYTPSDPAATICYQAHVENVGWQPAVCGNGKMVGTTGQNLRMEAVRIWFTSYTADPTPYGVCYRAHVQDLGWMSSVCNGVTAGTTGQFRRMEAITISPHVKFH